MTFEKFRDEFYRQAGVLAKGTDPYLPAAYEYIENRLEALAPISIEQAEQLNPTDLRDATRVESPKIGVSEANARARGDNMIGRSLTEEEADDLILESAPTALRSRGNCHPSEGGICKEILLVSISPRVDGGCAIRGHGSL